MKKIITALFGLALILGIADAQEVKTIEGVMSCEKCNLKTADACADVLQAGGVTYLLEQDGKRKTAQHQCSGTAKAKVTGKVEDRKGKKYIVVSKIEKEG